VMRRRREIETGLRQALARNELRLEFQPLMGLKEGCFTGLEALLRWDSSEHGAIGPDEFIPVAEETGLIVPIGEWVLREACEAAMAWPGEPRVAVNLSSVQFRKGKLFDVVATALRDSGLPAKRLEL